MNSSFTSTKSRNEAHQQAFDKAVQAMSENMPLLLHGSGDVMPSQVKPETAHLLSVLTVQYIEKLVSASLEAHFHFLSEADGGGDYKVPPPSFSRDDHTLPSKPPPFSVTHPPSTADKKKTQTFASTAAAAASIAEELDESTKQRERPPKRLREEYWDEALPKPKIRSKQPPSMDAATKEKPVTAFTSTDPALEELPPPVPLRDWVGAMGVDLRRDAIRKAHVKNALGTASIVFGICHDTYAYNRVREIRAAKRTLDPLVTDSVLTDMIATEGRVVHHTTDRDEAKPEDDPQDEEEAAARDNEEGGGPEWPGLEYVLPVHLRKDY